jgi:hypothetical protein
MSLETWTDAEYKKRNIKVKIIYTILTVYRVGEDKRRKKDKLENKKEEGNKES